MSPNADQVRPSLIGVGHMLVDVALGQHYTTVGQCRPTLGQHRPKSDPARPSLVDIGHVLHNFGPNRSTCHPSRTRFGRHRACAAQLWPTSAKLWPALAKIHRRVAESRLPEELLDKIGRVVRQLWDTCGASRGRRRSGRMASNVLGSLHATRLSLPYPVSVWPPPSQSIS